MLDESFGVIPLQKRGETMFVLLVQHLEAHGGHWAFPKGHKNEGESDQDCALRELHEETGITQVMLMTEKVFDQSYFYTRDNKKIDKHVVYYLGWVNDTTVTPQSSEIQNYGWLPLSSAVQRLSFEGTKELLLEVIRYL